MTEEEENEIIHKNIKEHGCHILQIMEENNSPRFSYSIGIQKTTGQPELIITGLKFELAHSIINNYNQRIKDGEHFEEGKFYSDFIEGFDITFKSVEKKHYKEYLGYGLWLHKGDNFKVMQMIYPNTSGIWPWDKKAPEDFLWFMPKLYKG